MQIQCRYNMKKQSIGQSLYLWCNSITLLTEPDVPVGHKKNYTSIKLTGSREDYSLQGTN